jgi:arylsulfatase
VNKEEGILFSQAISQSPHTPGSFPSLLSSTYPFQYGGEGFLSDERVTIAELLKQEGYTTAAFHSNPYLSWAYNYNKGFDDFDDSLLLGKNKLLTLLHRVINYFKVEPYLTAEEINKRAIFWLKKQRSGEKIFLWLHYMDPHGPYQPPAEYQREFLDKVIDKKTAKKLWRRTVDDSESITEYERKTLIGLYDAEIRYLDEHIGKLIKKLKELSFFDKTLIVITADHGEQFQEHGKFNHPRQLYDELLRVPLIFIAPTLPKGGVISNQVRTIDIVPTIFDILGLKFHKNFEGTSLLPLINGEKDNLKLDAISEVEGEKEEKSVRKFSIGNEYYKYILVIDQDGNETQELYDLRKDPREQNNLANEDDEEIKKIMRSLDSKLRGHIAKVEQGYDVTRKEERKMSEEEIKEIKKRLRGLGYLDG